MHQLTKHQRKLLIYKAWTEMVGELPANVSRLPNFAKVYGLVPTLRAIEKCADDDSLEDSESVLEAVEKQLKDWERSRLLPLPNIYEGL